MAGDLGSGGATDRRADLTPRPAAQRGETHHVHPPITALLLATLLTMYVLGVRRGWEGEKVQRVATSALEPVGLVLLVTGAGGVFGAVLEASDR